MHTDAQLAHYVDLYDACDSIIIGHFHQGNIHQNHSGHRSYYAGSQCTAIATVSCVYAFVKNPVTWNAIDLDLI